MKALGIVLIVLGMVGLVYGGVSWTRRETVFDAGPVEIATTKRESVPVPPIVGGLLLAVGVVLVMRKK